MLRRFRYACREDKLDVGHVNRSVRSYMAHLEHGDTWRMRRNVLRHLVLRRDTSWDCEYDMTVMDGGLGYYS